MSLKSLLEKIAKIYPRYYQSGKVDKDATAFQLVVQDLPAVLKQLTPHSQYYKFHGSTGLGNLTPAPWVAAFDLEITKSAQEGYYLVYLYSVCFKRVYLCLGMGATQFEENFGKGKKFKEAIRPSAIKLLSHIKDSLKPSHNDSLINLINDDPRLKGKKHWGYEQGIITAVKYDLNEMPTDDALLYDYQCFLNYYSTLKRIAGPIDVSDLADDQISDDDIREPEIANEYFELPLPVETVNEKTGTSGYGSKKTHGSNDSKKIGDIGEEVVFEWEKERLLSRGFQELSNRVEWVAKKGEKPGYDIRSFNEDGSDRFIEVKSTKAKQHESITITENEWQTARNSKLGTYFLYFVTNVVKKPSIQIWEDPGHSENILYGVNLIPATYRLKVR